MNAVNAMRFASGQSGAAGGRQSAWDLLGVDPRADPFDALGQISKRIKEMEQDDARSLLAGIGMGDAVFHLLRRQDIPVDNGLGENTRNGTTHAFRPLGSLEIVNSLLGVAGNTLNEIAGVAGSIPGARREIHDRVKNDATRTLAVGNSNDWSLGGESASGGELGALIDTIAEPTKRLLTLFGNAYEIPISADGANRELMENVREAFGKWEKIDPEQYAFAMVDYLKTQALPMTVATTVASMGTTPPANVNVTQYIDSDGDARDVARRIADEIETAGRQCPTASY